jgi:hypothetical protein
LYSNGVADLSARRLLNPFAMKLKNLPLAGIFAGVVSAAAFAGCSSQDPGAVTFTTRHNVGGNTGSGSNQDSTGADSGSSGGGGAGVDAGPGAGGGTDAGGAPHDAAIEHEAEALNAFTGAAPYASKPVATSAEQEHANRNVGTVPTGLGCIGCHNGATATRFSVGGTIYSSAAATSPAPDAEIRIVKADGTEYASVHSDANGNFWVVDAAGFAALNGLVGARDGANKVLMTTPLSKEGCNGCHDGTATPRVHLP